MAWLKLHFLQWNQPRLLAAGFEVAGTRGSHVKFAPHSGDIIDTVMIPSKHDVPVGTQRSTLNQAHIDPDEWERLG